MFDERMGKSYESIVDDDVVEAGLPHHPQRETIVNEFGWMKSYIVAGDICINSIHSNLEPTRTTSTHIAIWKIKYGRNKAEKRNGEGQRGCPYTKPTVTNYYIQSNLW